MNKRNARAFLDIRSAAETYKTNVTKALLEYQAEIERAKTRANQFKNEQGVFNSLKGNAEDIARKSVKTSADAFAKTIKNALDSLRKELTEAVGNAPQQKYLESLHTFRDFGIKMTRNDVESLLAMNAGNLLGLRALTTTLKSTDSPFRIDFVDVSVFEKDISMLEKLSADPPLWTPMENHSTACSIFNGVPVWGTKDGRIYDGVAIITSRGAFENAVKDLEIMETRWTTSVTPSVEQIHDYRPKTNGVGEEVSAEQQFINDFRQTAESASVIDNAANSSEAFAKMFGEKQSEDARNYAKVMDLYTK